MGRVSGTQISANGVRRLFVITIWDESGNSVDGYLGIIEGSKKPPAFFDTRREGLVWVDSKDEPAHWR